MHSNRFVSIGTYLPSAMLIAVNFSITSILLWVLSGRPATKSQGPAAPENEGKKRPMTVVEYKGRSAVVPVEETEIAEREMFLPLACVFGAHTFGLVPLYVLNQIPDQVSIRILITDVLVTDEYVTVCSKLRFRLVGFLHLGPDNAGLDGRLFVRPDPAADHARSVLLASATRSGTRDSCNGQLCPSTVCGIARQSALICAAARTVTFDLLSGKSRGLRTCGDRHACHFTSAVALRKQSLFSALVPWHARRSCMGLGGRTGLDEHHSLDHLVASLGVWDDCAVEWAVAKAAGYV